MTITLLLSAFTPRALALAPVAPADTVRVGLVTFYPGHDIYELFGHSEIHIVDPAYGDYYFNYGVFDFNAPNFLWRFVTGDTEYWCIAMPPRYAGDPDPNRRMVEQTLALDSAQAKQLSNALVENARPGNNTYRYRYLSDNCATRPRDMIERALGQEIAYTAVDSADSEMEPLTFRRVMRHYTRNYPWEQFGIDLVLGSACDTTITWRQAMFVPLVLRHAAAQARVTTSNGGSRPLVTRERILVDGPEEGTVLPPTPWYLAPMTAALLVLAIVALMTWKRPRRPTKWLDVILFTLLALPGCVIAFLLCVSEHEAVSPNYNILWLHPLLLVIVVLTTAKSGRKALRVAHGVNTLLIVAMAVVWATGLQVPAPAFLPLAAASLTRSINGILLKDC